MLLSIPAPSHGQLTSLNRANTHYGELRRKVVSDGRGNEAEGQSEVGTGENVREEPWRERERCPAVPVIFWG